MATNTGILDLVKPAGNENALISVINSNMDKLDAEAGRSRGNIAANYSTSSAYDVGDLCIYQGNLYRCNTAIASGEEWTAAHWTQVNIAGELDSQKQAIANKLGTDDIADNLTTTTAGKVLDARQGAILSRDIAVHEVTDCNDAIEANYRPYFFMCVTGSNRPDSNVFFGITMRYDNNNLGQIGFSSAGFYRRYRSWGTWTAWTKVG